VVSHIQNIGNAGDATRYGGYAKLAFNSPFNYYRHIKSDITSPDLMRHLPHFHLPVSPDKNFSLIFCLGPMWAIHIRQNATFRAFS
jgi:hypothetical protein